MRINNFFKLIIAIVICESAGAVGAIFTTPAISSGWYSALVKPALNPPAWIFGPVWTTLFALMGASLFLVWNSYSDILKNTEMLPVWKRGIALFAIQLALNTLWSFLFFGMHSPGAAFIDIIFLWLSILGTIIIFSKISKLSAWLLLPYILWVSFASYLNYAIWALN